MISVRQAGEGDVELLAELYRLVHEVHLNRMPERFKPVETGAVSEWFRSMIPKPAVRAWIAESEGSAVGYVLAVVQDRPETLFRYRRVVYHLEQIAVAPAFRRTGVARELIDCVVADARERGVQDLEGNSWFFNTGAHDLVLSLGFHVQIIRFSRTVS
jgi:GNAT superfamily N-acetyltransferase